MRNRGHFHSTPLRDLVSPRCYIGFHLVTMSGDPTHCRKRRSSLRFKQVKKAVLMPASRWQLNRFERILFTLSLAVAALIILVRLGAVGVIWYMHHVR